MGLIREKFIRLQHENKMLRVQQEECEREKIAALQAQLEEAHKAQSELDTENRSDRLLSGVLPFQDVLIIVSDKASFWISLL